MDFEAKTIDEELKSLADSFDAAIAPKYIWRNNNNKLYLILKSIGAGFSKIRDLVLSLKYRFDARYCSDDDLQSAMYVTGERVIPGKASMLRIVAVNTDVEAPAKLAAGVYTFTSSDGEPFLCEIANDQSVGANGYVVLLFTSRDVGAWPVSASLSAAVSREDGAEINSFFTFEVYDNSSSLGRPAETNFDIRQRILADTLRQDTLRELELAIRALPTIFECNLIFNPDSSGPATLEDGTILAPKELLIVITGIPNQDLADTVVSREIYKTHMQTTGQVVYYYNPLFINGRYPVYYMFHSRKMFYLTINYRYDRQKKEPVGINTAFDAILRKYKFLTNHIDEINEPLIYRELENHGIDGVELRKIYIQVMTNGSLTSVASVEVPKLSIPELAGTTYIGEEIV